MEPRALSVLGMYSTTELNPQHKSMLFKDSYVK
jgi:hypothetical protein